jgi:hypothetical protein
MGHGVALVAARSGFDVSMVDIKDEFVQRGMGGLRGFLKGSEAGQDFTGRSGCDLSHIRTLPMLMEKRRIRTLYSKPL